MVKCGYSRKCYRLFLIYYLCKVPKKSKLPSKEADIDPENDPALLQYTGGTTGMPKAAILFLEVVCLHLLFLLAGRIWEQRGKTFPSTARKEIWYG